jgi:hypothetical protein
MGTRLSQQLRDRRQAMGCLTAANVDRMELRDAATSVRYLLTHLLWWYGFVSGILARWSCWIPSRCPGLTGIIAGTVDHGERCETRVSSTCSRWRQVRIVHEVFCRLANPTEEVDCSFAIAKGGVFRKLGGACGVRDTVLNGTNYMYLCGGGSGGESCVVQA